ncbi:MAG: hypothetical protein ABIN58_13005 [candidate division WOR-3 bacterium]
MNLLYLCRVVQVGNYVDNGAIIPLDTVLYPIFTGLEMMGVNIYLFKIRKTRYVKPRALLKEMRQKEVPR